MTEDSFNKWYEETYPDLNKELDDFYPELLKAYEAGYKRHMELDYCLQELVELGELFDEYELK